MTDSNLSCYTRPERGVQVLVLEGALDLATAPQAAEALTRFLGDHGPEVILDASRLDFVDSKGVGTLLTAAKLAQDQNGRIYLLNPSVPVRRILEICGLSALFPPPAELPAPPSLDRPSSPRPNGARSRPARTMA